MAEQLVVKNWGKCKIVPFLKIVFCNIAPLGDQKKHSHMKVKSKISYAEVDVDVKNVTEYTAVHSRTSLNI